MKRGLSDQRVLLTGASSGIGRAIALHLAREGCRLVLTARRTDRLEDVASACRSLSAKTDNSVQVVSGDVKLADDRERMIEATNAHFGGLDILINNAGIGGIGQFVSADAARLRQIMEVNFFAPAELIRLAIPHLRRSDDGTIVNVGSVLGHCAVPMKSEYCASKFALHGFTDALRMELHAMGIEVLLISPSTTSSEFFDQALRSEGKAHENPRAMTPEEVAANVIAAIRNGKREVILSLGGKLLVWADRLAPGMMNWALRTFG